jgi:hypothetical protein
MEEFETIPPLSQQQHDSSDKDTPPPKQRRGVAKTWIKAKDFAPLEAEGVGCVRSTGLQPNVSHPYSAAAAVPDSFFDVI